MRTNKKKLAALAMSVVMAASTMSLSAFAEEAATDVVTEEAQETAETLAAAVYVTGADISEDGTVTVTYSDQTTETWPQKATSEQVAATCTTGAATRWSIAIDGTTYHQNYETSAPLGHAWSEWARETIDHGDCSLGKAGQSALVRRCSRCGEKEVDENSYESVPASHNLTKATRTNLVAGNNVEIVNGEAVLKNTAKNGTYYVVTEKQCTMCDGWFETDRKTEKLYASTGERATTKVVKVTNIKSGLAAGEEIEVGTDGRYVDEDKIILTNCSKDATYTVEDFDAKGNSLGTATYTITARHSEGTPTVVGKTAADKELIQVIYDTKGNITDVVSKSCYKSATYVWTVKCLSDTCSYKNNIILEEERTAEPAGTHKIKASAEAAVKALQDNAKRNAGYATQKAYDAFLEAANATGSGMKYNASVVCNEGGTVTITYICEECGEEIADGTVTVNIGKFDHSAEAKARQENRVEATCTTNGSYDSVTHCKYCDAVMATRKVTLAKLGHTTEKDGDKNAQIRFEGSVVVGDGTTWRVGSKVGANGFVGGGAMNVLTSYGVQVDAVTACERCGEATVVGTPEITIAALQKETKETAGSITLNASYKTANGNKVVTDTVTVPYYSDLGAYFDRNPEEKPINGLQLDADGVVRYYKDSVFQADYAGIAEYNGGEFFVANGVVCSAANGLNEYNGTWYYLANGQVQRGFNGLALYDGAWFYLTNGVLDTNVSGLVPYNGGTFLFTNGRLRNDVNGLWQNSDGTWYFLALGQVQNQHTGVAIYDGEAFYVRDGKLAKDYKGTVQYDGATFNVVNGQLYGPVA